MRQKIRTESKKFQLLAQQKTRVQQRLWKLHEEFQTLDYALALEDGRLTKLAPVKTPTIRCRISEKPKKSNSETVREAFAKMSEKDRQELFNSLLN